jgi:hypothetical protein
MPLASAPADERLLVAPVRQRQDPSLAGQAPVADVVDETIHLLQLRLEHPGIVEIGVPVIRLRVDFEYDREHVYLRVGKPWNRLLDRVVSNRNAIHLDVEPSWQCGNANVNPRGWVPWKVSSIDRVDRCKFLDRRAIHVAFEHVLQRRSRRLQAKLELFQNQFRLALDWGVDHLSGVGVEWRKPGDVDRIAASSDDRRGRPVQRAWLPASLVVPRSSAQVADSGPRPTTLISIRAPLYGLPPRCTRIAQHQCVRRTGRPSGDHLV